MHIQEIVGKNIVVEREKRGLTQKQLSEITGLATSGLRQIEHGERAATISSLGLVAEALGVPVHTLFLKHKDRDYIGAKQSLDV